ncbi:MAG: hypothetical protein SFY68_15670 [Candidatus Sumerlaeia bacterium]|nr:hypothetical protein [Candidatus Sumerlaeia bacterium]
MRGKFFLGFLMAGIVPVSGLLAAPGEAVLVSPEIPTSTEGWRVVSPCDVLLERWREHHPESQYPQPGFAPLNPQRISGMWFGGPLLPQGEGYTWSPGAVQLDCSGAHVPFELTSTGLQFSLLPNAPESTFSGTLKGGALLGHQTDSSGERLALYYPIPESGAPDGSTLLKSVILDRGPDAFCATFEVGKTWYYYDGTTLNPAWPHRWNGLMDSTGRHVEFLHEDGRTAFQVRETHPLGSSIPLPVWEPFQPRQLPGMLYFPTPNEKQTELILLSPEWVAAVPPEWMHLLAVFFNRHGWSVLALDQAPESEPQAVEAFLEESLLRHRNGTRVLLSIGQPRSEWFPPREPEAEPLIHGVISIAVPGGTPLEPALNPTLAYSLRITGGEPEEKELPLGAHDAFTLRELPSGLMTTLPAPVFPGEEPRQTSTASPLLWRKLLSWLRLVQGEEQTKKKPEPNSPAPFPVGAQLPR